MIKARSKEHLQLIINANTNPNEFVYVNVKGIETSRNPISSIPSAHMTVINLIKKNQMELTSSFTNLLSAIDKRSAEKTSSRPASPPTPKKTKNVPKPQAVFLEDPMVERTVKFGEKYKESSEESRTIIRDNLYKKLTTDLSENERSFVQQLLDEFAEFDDMNRPIAEPGNKDPILAQALEESKIAESQTEIKDSKKIIEEIKTNSELPNDEKKIIFTPPPLFTPLFPLLSSNTREQNEDIKKEVKNVLKMLSNEMYDNTQKNLIREQFTKHIESLSAEDHAYAIRLLAGQIDASKPFNLIDLFTKMHIEGLYSREEIITQMETMKGSPLNEEELNEINDMENKLKEERGSSGIFSPDQGTKPDSISTTSEPDPLPFAASKIVQPHPVKYHKTSIQFVFGNNENPEYDPELSTNVYNSAMSKQELIERMDALISAYGAKFGTFKRLSDTVDEYHELVQMQFCFDRMLQRGPRAKMAMVPIKSLVDFSNKLSGSTAQQPAPESLASKTNQEIIDSQGPEGPVPGEESVGQSPMSQQASIQPQTGVQVQIDANKTYDKIANAYRNSTMDQYHKPIYSEIVMNIKEEPEVYNRAPRQIHTSKKAFELRY